MKSYLLLRDNQQSGPYTYNEIKQKELQPYDLVWIEGESKSWSYPTEITELKQYVSTKTSAPKPKKKTVNTTSVATVPQTTFTSATTPAVAASPVYDLYEDVNRELYEGVKITTETKRRRVAALNANIMALLLIVIGVAMGAFVVKNIVASFSTEEPIASAEAKEIESISYESQHAAMAEQQPVAQPAVLTEQALQIPAEALPAQPTESEKQQIINDSKPAEVIAKEKEEAQALAATTEAPPQAAEQPVQNTTEPKEEPKKEEKKSANVRSQLQVSGSDYKVGVLGGVSDLEISVSNGSSSVVNRATVEVSFLKANGSVVSTKTVEVRNIQPGSSKRVPVPPSSRGTKVSYRVIDADAQ